MSEHKVTSTHVQTGRFVKLCTCGFRAKGFTVSTAYAEFLNHCDHEHLAASYTEDDDPVLFGDGPVLFGDGQ